MHKHLNLQINKNETAPHFIQLSQNLTSDCLLTSVYLLVFTSFCIILIIKLFCFDLQNNFMSTIMQKQGNSAKSANNPKSSFGLIK